jgi:hypothetical protein
MDLGDNHWLRFTSWKPDRELNPQYEGFPDIERLGAIMTHKTPNGIECEGSIFFDSEVTRKFFESRDRWTVESWEPLTLMPSVLCHCGDHGFVHKGRWVHA